MPLTAQPSESQDFIVPAYERSQPAQQLEQVLLGEWLQLKDLRAGDERGIDEEERVVRSRADEPDHAALHIRQQHVLLGFVEAVNLVNEQDGRG